MFFEGRENLHLRRWAIRAAFAFICLIVPSYAALAEEGAEFFADSELSGPAFAGKPVSLLTGAETFSRTDLSLGELFPIVIKRRYHSVAGYDSPLGYGWAHNYDRRLYTYADGAVVIRKETGWKRRFEFSGEAYVTPVGEYGVLVQNADDSFTYALKDGSREEYDSLGRLSQVVSPRGASLVLTYQAAQREPLEGLLPANVDQTAPLIVAYDYRLARIEERDSTGTPTGAYVDFSYDPANGRLIGLQDSLGRSVSYSHDAIGNLTAVTAPGIAAEYGYADPVRKHVVTRISEGEGEYVNTYDPQGRVIKQTHGTGVIDFAYLTPRQKTKVTTNIKDSAGTVLNVQTRTIEFDSYGQPAKVTDTFGNESRYTRNSLALVTREERWENTGTVAAPVLTLKVAHDYTYDGLGNLLTKTEAAGSAVERLTTYTYHPIYNRVETETVKSVVDPGQNKVTSHLYDAATGNLLSTTETGLLGSGSSYSYTTAYSYNSRGQITGIDGPRTDVSDSFTLAYDSAGNLTGITRPLSGTTTFADHDGLGNPRTVTDPNGAVTLYTYDAVGKVLTVKAPGDSQPTTYTYISAGCTNCGTGIEKIDTVQLPEGTLIDFDYDEFGNLNRITDGLGNSLQYSYDSAGNRLSEEIRDPANALQKSLAFQYDALNRVAKVINPDNSYTQFGYDSRGNRTSVRDPKGNTTSYQYDALSRLVLTTQPGNIGTSFGYDGNNNLASVMDGNNNATTYQYDDLGRVYRVVSPDTGTTTYTYDAAGNMTAKTDAKNVTIQYQYDAESRLTRIDFPSDTDILYAYDACVNGKGRLCSVTDQSGTTAYEYTAKGQIAKETKTILGVQYVTQYAYDMNGNVTAITYPSGRTITYSYSNNQPTSVTSNGSPVAIGITYKPFGGFASLTYGNGRSRTVSYDNQYRISGIQTGTLQNLTYGYDASGNITAITNNLDGTKNKTYGYDALDRLNAATGSWGSLGWTYDPVGNRLTQTDGSGTATYSYQPSSNRLAGISGSQSAIFSHDANGNMIAEDGKAFTYNQNQRLIQAAAAQTGEYVYNANGQRASKAVNGQTTVFLYDLAGQLIAETDAQGASLAEYLHFNGQPLAKIDTNGINYIHPDHLGTPVVMTNGAGEKVWEIESRPFGDQQTITGAGSLNLRFPGQYFDAETGLHQNWFRDYDSRVGRYVQADPIGLMGGINLFSYVKNNPINLIDPSGEIPIAIPIGVGIIVLGGASQTDAGKAVTADVLKLLDPRPLMNAISNVIIGPWPGSGTKEESKAKIEPWPGSDDWRGQCIRLYALCVEREWSGNCGACLNKCTAQQEWPFEDCSPRGCK